MIKNEFFEVKFNRDNGTINSILNLSDKDCMNWCGGEWGYVHSHSAKEINPKENATMELIEFKCENNRATSLYSNTTIQVKVERFFNEKNNLVERFTIKNLFVQDVFIEHGNLGIEVSPDNEYKDAQTCMTQKCQSHLWCGHNTTYMNSLKMGKSDINLGLIVTKGSFATYSTKDSKTNQRGSFILNSDHLELLPQEEYVIEWELFWHKGNDDFCKIISTYGSYIGIEAKYYTFFRQEDIEFNVVLPKGTNNLKIVLNECEIPYKKDGNKAYIRYCHDGCGEYRFDVFADDLHTYTEFYVSEEINKLIENRVNMIIDKHQYFKTGSCLDGAYLVYDNEEKVQIYNDLHGCQGACTERLCMAMLLTRYAIKTKSQKVIKSLEKFIKCMYREFYDRESGIVYGHFLKDNRGSERLYNAPWFTTLCAELYFLTSDKEYLSDIEKALDVYYKSGGYRFYPNGLSPKRVLEAFIHAGLEEKKEKILKHFKLHVDTMVAIGDNYPKHEVNYEQTIVTPAVTFMSELAVILGDEKYIEAAKSQLERLEIFNGHQPSFHMNEMPIRFWDLFFGGKSRNYGDNYPHAWACLTARSYKEYYIATKDEKYNDAADVCMRNCLCLYKENGEGTIGYMYPYKANGEKGQKYDEYSAEQDFILYFAMDLDFFKNKE